MSEIREFFAGKWCFTREVYQEQSLYAKGKGEATFVDNPSTGQVVYHEVGAIRLIETDNDLSFYRSFLYDFAHEKIKVYFNDGANKGKLYQQYVYQQEKQIIQSVCEHLCVADFYNGVYFLIDQSSFRLETTVKGPKKNIFIRTLFCRIT